MDYQTFLEKLTVALELKTILKGAETLADLPDWDSFRMLSVLALADQEFGRRLIVAEIAACRTVRSLYDRLVGGQ